jgi:PIN domain nuclease of toxin-antitoxin system
MNLLLDTHIWIWNHLEPWKIASAVNQALADTENQLWLSPVSIWGLVMLLEKKRIRLNEDMNTWVEKSKKELSLREAPFSWAVAHEMRFTLLGHGDPYRSLSGSAGTSIRPHARDLRSSANGS